MPTPEQTSDAHFGSNIDPPQPNRSFDGRLPADIDVPLHELFARNAQIHAENAAVICGKRNVDYRELHARSRALANHLLTLGVQAGEPIGVYLDPGPEMIVAVVGILMAGGAYLPLDPSYPPERLAFMFDDAEASTLITERSQAERLPLHAARVVCVDEIREPTPAQPVCLPWVDAYQMAYLIYTSGSTGQPKGVMITHRSAVNTVLDINRRFQVGASDRVLALSSLCFDLSVYDIFGLLAVGGAIVIPEPRQIREPACWVELIEEHEVTVWNTVPAFMEVLTTYLARGQSSGLRSLRRVFLSGDWIPVSLPERIQVIAPRAHVISLGGATEAAIWSIYFEVDRVDPDWKSIPYGKPLANQSVHVLDDHLQQTAVGVTGEIYIGGVGVAVGYLNRPELNAQKFIVDPYATEPNARLYRSGDLGCYLPDGNIEFLGRIDHQVKIRGFRIELGEIESALVRHSQVGEAVVVARQGAAGGKYLAAYVVMKPAAAATDAEFVEWLRKDLPEHMVPARFVRLQNLPLNVNGKVDRAALPEPNLDTDDIRRFVLPQTPTEKKLARLWSEVLQLERIGRNDDFLQLGGDSLQAVQLLVRIEESFHIRLDLSSALGQTARLAQLAERIDAGNGRVAHPYIAPRDAYDLRLTRSWEKFFDVRPIGIHDSFYELGGTASFAQELASEILEQFGEDLSPDFVREHPTIAQLAERLRGGPHLGRSASLVVIQASGHRPPLVCVPGIFGTTWEFRKLARSLGAEFPIYALQPVGLDGQSAPHASIEEIADHYIRELRAVQPTGPYYLAGHSLGGTVAFEMAQRLHGLGEKIGALVLMDAPMRGHSRMMRLLQRAIHGLSRFANRTPTNSALSAAASNVAIGLADEFDLEDTPPSPAGLRLLKAHRQALDKYRPRPYAGRAIMFRPQLGNVWYKRLFESSGDWMEICDLGGEAHVVPGDHLGIFKSGNIEFLAARLRSCLAGD